MTTPKTLQKRYLKNIRLANPKPDDTILVTTLNNHQSYTTLKLTLQIETQYNTKIHTLHLGPPPPPPLKQLTQQTTLLAHIPNPPKTYTQLKLQTLTHAQTLQDPLIILPLAAEDIAIYMLQELLNTNLAGLQLDTTYRTAYPLATTTLQELRKLDPTPLPATTLQGPAQQLLQQLQTKITPTATAKTYLQLLATTQT